MAGVLLTWGRVTRRGFLMTPAMLATAGSSARLGVDLFSLRSQNWSPFEALDYCAGLGARLVHFSEIRFLGGLDPQHLRQVRAHATKLGIAIEIGMRSCCPTSKMFDAKLGTAEEQLTAMLEAAREIGSGVVRAVVGSAADRDPIERHIESTVRVLRNVRSRALDLGVKIAIENHAGDMQARELKSLVEGAGKDFVGVCLDSGNPLWTLEDPHLTLETLHPYVLTAHFRDSAVWRVPQGAAVAWVRMGDGNVGMSEYIASFRRLCPERAVTLEIIVTNARAFPYLDPKFREAYRGQPEREFSRFVKLVEAGEAREDRAPVDGDAARVREREDLEASVTFTRNVLNV
jgi:sugar phosphate isomerase/epimerase